MAMLLACVDVFNDDFFFVAGEVGSLMKGSLHVGIHYDSRIGINIQLS
jgi:hypothetical protein